MGRWALEMNLRLSGLLSGQAMRTMHWHPETTTSHGMAVDGFHPSADGYALWADGLSQRILASGWRDTPALDPHAGQRHDEKVNFSAAKVLKAS
jgi:hypothetical protein